MPHVRGMAPVLDREVAPILPPVSARGLRAGAAALALALGGALLCSLAWRPAPPPRAVRLADKDVPLTLAGYVASGDLPLSRYIQGALPGADIIERDYRRGPSQMDFLLIRGTHGVALHDPRFCMGALLLSEPRTERLAGTPVAMQLYQASSHAGTPPDLLVAYFYAEGGRIISSPSQIRASLLWGDLLGRANAPVYFFRFIQPLTPRADAHLRVFASQAWQALRPRLNDPPS